MAGSSGFSISIKAVDQTAGPLDSINKRLARLSAPAERFNKSVAKFGEVSGINRVSEGFGSLGRSAHDAFMSVDRLAGPLAALTSAGSIAGMAALASRWADLGTSISRTSFRLSMPVEKLSALQGAGQRFGATADTVSQSLAGLRDTLYGGAFRGEKLSFLHGVGLDQAPGQVMDTMKALHILADKVHGEKDVHTKLRIITEAGMSPDMLGLLDKGGKGIDEEMQRQADLGGTMTQKMTDDAVKTKQSFDDLGTAVGGVANRLGNELGNAVRGYVESAAVWIGKNQDLADSYAKIGGSIMALGALKPAAWVLRLLGLGALVDAAPAIAAGAVLGGAGALAGQAEAPMVDENGRVVGNWGGQKDESSNPAYNNPAAGAGLDSGNKWWRKHMPTWLGGDDGSSAQATSATPHSADATNHLLDNLSNSQLGKLLAKGEAGAADYNAVNRGAAGSYASGMENLVNMTVGQVQAAQKNHRFNAAGRYQVIGPTLDSAVADMGLTGNEKFDKSLQDRIFEQYLIGSKRPEIGDYITGKSNDRHAALLGMSKEWASVADPDTGLSHYGDAGKNKASISPGAAGAALDEARGHVHVEVTLKGAPPGTTAKVASSGAVTAPPPRIETPMWGVM